MVRTPESDGFIEIINEPSLDSEDVPPEFDDMVIKSKFPEKLKVPFKKTCLEEETKLEAIDDMVPVPQEYEIRKKRFQLNLKKVRSPKKSGSPKKTKRAQSNDWENNQPSNRSGKKNINFRGRLPNQPRIKSSLD